MKKYKFNYFLFLIAIIFIQSCATRPPENPDNICLIFKEKKNWYKAAIRSEKRWKIPPYVLMSFVYQESSFKADARPEREKILGKEQALGLEKRILLQLIDQNWKSHIQIFLTFDHQG